MTDIDARRRVEAAAWRARLTETEAESNSEFQAWLAADRENAVAWKSVQRAWHFFGEHATAPEILRLRRIALAHAHQTGTDKSRYSERFAVTRRIAVAAGVLALVVGAAFAWRSGQPEVYQTHRGERRVVTLADGSQIALDSESEVKVHYTAHTRELLLTRGQARFDVAHDVSRPFTVTADGQTVVATGTAFNVDLLGSDLRVTLIEGHVVVVPATADVDAASIVGKPGDANMAMSLIGRARPPHPVTRITLEAGEQLKISLDAPPSIDHVNLDRATAWQNGELVFENEPLAIVVARVNRYAQHPIEIDDDGVSELRISGVFHAGDVNGFVTTVGSYLPVRVQSMLSGSTRLSLR